MHPFNNHATIATARASRAKSRNDLMHQIVNASNELHIMRDLAMELGCASAAHQISEAGRVLSGALRRVHQPTQGDAE